MPAHAYRLKLRLFLEGVEVPMVSIQMQCQPNAPIVASIQVPPCPEGTRLMPRTLIHVFFFDQYEENSPIPLASRKKEFSQTNQMDANSYERTMNQSAADVAETKDVANDLTKFKVFFIGELMGFEWSKTPTSRSLVLQCADLSNYWDYAYQWSNTDLFGPGIKAMFSGGSTNLFTDFLAGDAEVITNILRTPSITFPKLKGLAGGIIHLLESIGGSYYYDHKIAGENIFFTLAELRLHINQMLMTIDDDTTAERLLAIQGYGPMMQRMLGGMGGQTSIRQAITAMQGVICYEMYGQPCPKYVPGVEGTVSGDIRKRLSDDPRTRFITDNAEAIRDVLKGMLPRLRITEGTDAHFSKLGSIEANLRRDLQTTLSKQMRLMQNTSMRMTRQKTGGGQALALWNSATHNVGVASTKLGKWSPSNPASITPIETAINAAITNLQQVVEYTVMVSSANNRQPARLSQQILRPDLWFGSPPRCNVLFPEHYTRLSYKRSFMEEPTRLMLKTNDEFYGEDELFDRLYFAPKTTTVKQAKADMQSLLSHDLLSHELFTGILPVFEKMGELNIFAVRGGISTDKVAQIGLAQRSANFLYFKYRFAARQMSVSGRFNPYVAPGFPGLVIDKYVDAESLRRYNEMLAKIGKPTRDITRLLGTAFLGNFTQVSYSVSQSSGTMDLVLSYPRQPDESVEFLGASDLATSTVNTRFNDDAIRYTDIAVISEPKIQSAGPNLGVILHVEEVTSLYSGDSAGDSTKPLLIFGQNVKGKPRSVAARLMATVPVGVEVDARDLDPAVLVELGLNPDTPFAKKAVANSSSQMSEARLKPGTTGTTGDALDKLHAAKNNNG